MFCMSRKMWLLVGFENDEVADFKHEHVTVNFKNADIIGDAFKIPTWKTIYEKYGRESFDAIVTDGGLYNIERVDVIICIKQGLLKPDGFIYNYTSIIGDKVEDPMGRGYTFYRIPKKHYTIQNHDYAWGKLTPKSWSDFLRKRVILIV